MRHRIFYIFFFLLFSSAAVSQRLMDIKVKNTDGDSVALSSFGGKKMLFVVLPASNNHDLYGQLDSFLLKHNTEVAIIGVFPADQSVSPAVKASVKNAFAGKSIMLTDDLSVKKDSLQSALFRWLSSSELNGHYNWDEVSIGDKFFVDEHARLYAVFPGRVSLMAPIMDKVVGTEVR